MRSLREQIAEVLVNVATDKYYGRHATAYDAALYAADLILDIPAIAEAVDHGQRMRSLISADLVDIDLGSSV